MPKLIVAIIAVSISTLISSCNTGKNCGGNHTLNKIWSGRAYLRNYGYKHRKIKDLKFSKAERKIEKRYEIHYTPDVFENLLNNITTYTPNNNQHSDGMRIYLAQYPINPQPVDSPLLISNNAKGRMCLIFVPTIEGKEYFDPVTKQTNHIHEDDLNHCFIISDNVLHEFDGSDKIKSQFLSNWINNYLALRASKFTTEGRIHTGDNDYEETQSLWYSKISLQHNSSPDSIGLIDYLHYFECRHKTNSINVRFASFLGSRNRYTWAYQLTLIFRFIGKGKNNNLFFFGQTINNNQAVTSKAVTRTGSTDTGVPCPPPPSGQQGCPGAQLPH